MTENKQEELNLETKITVKNIAGWSVGFVRIETIGDVNIMPEGSTKLSRSEVIAQVQNGNKLFCGVDDHGSHATIFIADEATRKYLDFDSDDGKRKQAIFTDDLVKDVFAKKTQSSFENAFKEAFQTRAEKYAVIQSIKRNKINDYAKIRFAEDYTGYKVV